MSKKAFEFVPYIRITGLTAILEQAGLYNEEKDGDLADFLFYGSYSHDSVKLFYLTEEAEYDTGALDYMTIEAFNDANVKINKINTICSWLQNLFPESNKILIDVTW